MHLPIIISQRELNMDYSDQPQYSNIHAVVVRDALGFTKP